MRDIVFFKIPLRFGNNFLLGGLKSAKNNFKNVLISSKIMFPKPNFIAYL